MERFVIAASEIVGDHDACSRGKTREKSDDRIDDAVRGADGRKGGLTDVIAHNDAVNRVVKLLKEAEGQKESAALQCFPVSSTVHRGWNAVCGKVKKS